MEPREALSSIGLPVLRVDPEWAWAPYTPSADCPWTGPLAAHLYRRAGFGAAWPMLERAVASGPQVVVDELMESSSQEGGADTDFGGWMTAAARSGNGETYVAWWLRRLLESRAVLREKMTLFWHNHFAIGLGAVGDLMLFHRHVEDLRSTGLQSVDALLRAQLTDPAMWVALGGAQNRRSQPNLTFARPWLATFTVGADLASEDAVREVARAFTGWFVYGDRMRWIEREHDRGEKRILGRVGPFDREDVLEMLANHPATARTVSARLFRWLVSETAGPSEALLAPLDQRLATEPGILSCVEVILRSNLFYSKHALGQKVKSPVEMMIGLGRAFDTVLPTQSMVHDLVRLGQRLDEPPTVNGWSGGSDWINSMTIAGRQRWCLAVLAGEEAYGSGLDPWPLAMDYGCRTASEAQRLWQEVLLNRTDPPKDIGASARGHGTIESEADGVRATVKRCLLDPSFQIN